MKKILVTGGAGFIGSNFIRHILSTYKGDVQVLNLDSLTYAGSLENLKDLSDNPGYKFVQGSINNTSFVEQLLGEYAIDTIVHFAAESHVDRSILGPQQFMETNVMGTFSMLEAARNI